MTTLLELIRALKESYKTNGDRELRPDVTALAILSPYAPEPPAPVTYVTSTASTNAPAVDRDPLGPRGDSKVRVRHLDDGRVENLTTPDEMAAGLEAASKRRRGK